MTSPPQPPPRTDEEVRQMHRDARRRAVVEGLQQVVTAERSTVQAVRLLRDLRPVQPDSEQEMDSLRLGLADVEAARLLIERARVLLTGSGAIT